MFSKETNSMEATMNAVNTVSEIHHLGEYVTEQNEGRRDQPINGNDLYNFAVQTDANFMTVRSDIRNMGTVMNSEFKLVDNEFKLVRMEIASGFAAVDARFVAVDARFVAVDARFNGVDNEFKLVRMEMASGFAAVDAEFKTVRAEVKEGFARLRIEIQRSNWRVSASTIVAMIALFGIDRFWR